MADLLKDSENRGPESPRADFDDCFNELYAVHYDALVIYLQNQFRSGPQQAEEIAQSAFERVATRKRRGPIGNLKAFLWRTAHNLAVSDIRSKKTAARYMGETRRIFSHEEGYPLTPERVMEAREQMEIAVAALRAMPERRRRAFILTRIEGLSHREVSDRLGISRPAVSKHVARAAADIYRAMHGESEDKDTHG